MQKKRRKRREEAEEEEEEAEEEEEECTGNNWVDQSRVVGYQHWSKIEGLPMRNRAAYR